MKVSSIPLLLPHPNSAKEISSGALPQEVKLSSLRNSGRYIPLTNQALVYRITDHERSYRGIIIGVDISHFTDGAIVHHEHIIPAKVSRQVKMADDKGGLSKPILLTHPPIMAVREIIDQVTQSDPLIHSYLEKYQATHQIWSISNEDHIKIIQQEYESLDHAYIVDGHHRTAAIQAIGEGRELRQGLCAFFDITELKVLPFHRIVSCPLSEEQLLQQLEPFGHIHPITAPEMPTAVHHITILMNESAYRFTWKTEFLKSDHPVDNLDVRLLSKHILTDVLQIQSNDHIMYTEGNRTIEAILSKMDRGQVAFLLYPITLEDLIMITDAGHLLPPKSTWFLPRIARGMVNMTFG